MTHRKRRLLTLVVLLALLTSCSQTAQLPETEADTATSETETTALDETTDPRYETDLSVRSFDDISFVIAVNDNPNIHHTVVPAEETADTLNDAMYRRNLTIEDTYAVALEEYVYSYKEASVVKNAVIAGEDSWSLVQLTCPDALYWWKENLLIPFDSLPNIDLSKGYWDQNINDSLSIGGVLYIAEGAFNLDIYDLTFCLLFNKTMASDLALDDLYEVVQSGNWTIDTMVQMMEQAANDSNGDGTMDESDTWGYTAHPKMVSPGFWIGSGVTTIAKDADDIPYISMTEERFISAFEKIMALAHDSGTVYMTEGDQMDIPGECRQLFQENRSLFMDMSFFYIESMRDMETDFGILPYPKYDSAQEDYHTRVCYYFPYVVPSTNTNTDTTGYLLEILQYRSYQDVLPSYYDICLKNKYTRDEESAAMLDLIFTSRVIDIGDSTLCDVIRDNFLYTMMKTDKRDLVSTVAKNENTINKRLTTLIQ